MGDEGARQPPPPHTQAQPYCVGQRVHAPTVLSQQATRILYTPVGCRVQWGPAIPIPELRVIAGLQKQPEGQGVWVRARTGPPRQSWFWKHKLLHMPLVTSRTRLLPRELRPSSLHPALPRTSS